MTDDRAEPHQAEPRPDQASRAYAAFLLRLWRAGDAAAVWHASLEDPHTGKRQGFADLAQLAAYLDALTGDGPARPPAPG